MAHETASALYRLSDSDLTLSSTAEDVRGRKVLDAAGEEVGEVDDLLVDEGERKVRYLRVASGGFLGIGETKFLIPVDAVTRVTDRAVHIDQARDRVAGAPRYDPQLTLDKQQLGELSGYYGTNPYWGPGYTYPAYPFYV